MENFEFIDDIDVSFAIDLVKAYDKKKWIDFDFRQKTYDVHKSTQTIPLIFDTDFRMTNPTHHPDAVFFEDFFSQVSSKFTNYFGEGMILRAILVKLLAKKNIAPHVDSGMSLTSVCRVHIPVITNDEVYFTVGNETKNLKKGEMWQINNGKKTHSVENFSDEDRIHFIIDWLPKTLILNRQTIFY